MIFEYEDTMTGDLEGAVTHTLICRLGATQICGPSGHETVSTAVL